MGWFDGIGSWFSDAADTVSGWAGYDSPVVPATSDTPYGGMGPLNPDIYGDTYSDYLNPLDMTISPAPDAGSWNEAGILGGAGGQEILRQGLESADPSLWDKLLTSLTSPAVLGAGITAGAGLFSGMSALDMQKQQLKAAEEQRKMQQMLELAKLKYQLQSSGGGGGARRSGGSSGGGGNPNAAINNAASANLASGYRSLGNSLSNIYKS